MRTPTTRSLKTFLAWIEAAQPLHPEENNLILNASDFISFSNEGHDNNLESLLEDMFSFLLPKAWMQRLFLSPIDYTSVHHYSKNRLALLAKMVVILVSVAFFTVPVFAIGGSETTSLTRYIVFGSSVSICAFAVTYLTRARAHEVFAATAA